MRYSIYILLISVLFCSTLNGQGSDLTRKEWTEIIDRANVVVTLAYIEELHRKSNPSVIDSIYFVDSLNVILSNSSFSNPLAFDSLAALLNPQFERTLSRLSSRIDTLKDNISGLDALFISLQMFLKDVKKEELCDANEIKSLRVEIEQYIGSNTASPVIAQTPNNKRQENSLSSSLVSIHNGIILILILLISYLGWSGLKKNKTISRLRNERRGAELERDRARETLSIIRSERAKLQEKLNQVSQVSEQKAIPDKPAIQHDLDPVVALAATKDRELVSAPESNHFYGGKPSPDRKFLTVTDTISDQETVFKFTYSNESRTKADFEVILVSEFMKREVTNAPDDLLYRVCNNSNSNQEFTREILTVRKGIAHFRDGVWVVEETDKALIKFQ